MVLHRLDVHFGTEGHAGQIIQLCIVLAMSKATTRLRALPQHVRYAIELILVEYSQYGQEDQQQAVSALEHTVNGL
jgi:phage-related protein